MNPYLILRVPQDADDAAIRRAYLNGIREFTPERDPSRFQAISRAYEQIRDETSRLKHRLCDHNPPGNSPGEVLENYCEVAPVKPMEFESMKSFLRSCLTK
ncbi:MAG: DnaJ domain-containing protein [Verrucomicrobiota bacterium]